MGERRYSDEEVQEVIRATRKETDAEARAIDKEVEEAQRQGRLAELRLYDRYARESEAGKIDDLRNQIAAAEPGFSDINAEDRLRALEKAQRDRTYAMQSEADNLREKKKPWFADRNNWPLSWKLRGLPKEYRDAYINWQEKYPPSTGHIYEEHSGNYGEPGSMKDPVLKGGLKGLRYRLFGESRRDKLERWEAEDNLAGYKPEDFKDDSNAMPISGLPEDDILRVAEDRYNEGAGLADEFAQNFDTGYENEYAEIRTPKKGLMSKILGR